ncbi:MAG: molecular chaperone DnaJ [Actinobacteria bacterium]|nr:molecular chaperone DnaJ [Actinomycetota bacterium]
MSKDYYSILGVDRSASEEEIKKAYRKKALEHHPDRGGDENKFKEASEAYEVLSDSEKKSRYDTYGTADGQGQGFNPNDFFSGFGDIFGDMFGRRPGQARRGQDIRVQIQLNILDILSGVRKKIKYNRNAKCSPCSGQGGQNFQACSFCGGSGQKTTIANTPFGRIQQSVTCPTCSGRGQQIKDKCSSCHGSGVKNIEETVEVDIPPGAVGGMQMAVPGKGHAAQMGTEGDLHVLIQEIEHPTFKRDGHNINVHHWIDIHEAVLGSRIEVEGPQKNIELYIPSGTESGKVFTYNSQGIPVIDGHGHQRGRGDLRIIVRIKIPKILSSEQREIFQKLREVS